MSKFGINCIDENLENMGDKGIYVFNSNEERLLTFFSLHFALEGLKNNETCIYITNKQIQSIIEEASFLGINLTAYLAKEQLYLLEIPAETASLYHIANNLSYVLNDLKEYIKEINPGRIIFDSAYPFLSDVFTEESFASFNRFSFFLKNVDSIILLGVLSLTSKIRKELDRISIGTFNLNYNLHDKNKNYLNYSVSNSDIVLFSLNFDLISHKTLRTFEQKQEFDKLDLKDLETIYVPDLSDNLVDLLKKNLHYRVQFIVYKSMFDLFGMKISNASLVFIPTMLENKNGYDACQQLRVLYPTLKIIFIGGFYTAPNQKVRAIRIGADFFLNYPFIEQNVLNLLYRAFPQHQMRHKHVDDLIEVLYLSSKETLVVNQNCVNKDFFEHYLRNMANEYIKTEQSLTFLSVNISNFPIKNQDFKWDTISDMLFVLSYKKTLLIVLRNTNLDTIAPVLAILNHNFNVTHQSKNISTGLGEKLLKNPLTEVNVNIQDFGGQTGKASEKMDYQIVRYPFNEVNIDRIIQDLF